MNILAADVGGTKTRLLCASAESPEQILYEA
jgi:glucokinase